MVPNNAPGTLYKALRFNFHFLFEGLTVDYFSHLINFFLFNNLVLYNNNNNKKMCEKKIAS